MHDEYRGRSEPLETLVQMLSLEAHYPEEICRAEAELVRLIGKHQHQVGDFASIPELHEAAERLLRLLEQHENGAIT
jgi:hypothetical protein